MDEFKDLNELLTVARQINEGKYALMDVDIRPSSELFSIAQYFNDSIKRIRTVSDTLGTKGGDIPAFEATLNSVIEDFQVASDEVLGYVDKINFNIDEAKELLVQIDQAVENKDYSRAAGLADRLKDSSVMGNDVCFDIISSLQFKEVSRQKIDKILDAVSNLEKQLSTLIIGLGLQQQVISPEDVDKMKDSKEILNDQTLVNKLLKEFGL